jgi:hypothetical protein
VDDDIRGRALLDLVIVVDSLDAFMLTGLKLGIPGCSPPKKNFYSCHEPGSLHIQLRMDSVVSSFPTSLTTYSCFRYACLISLVMVDVLSRCLQCCYGRNRDVYVGDRRDWTRRTPALWLTLTIVHYSTFQGGRYFLWLGKVKYNVIMTRILHRE